MKQQLVFGSSPDREGQGLAALFLVVVVGASALMLAFGASWLGLGELEEGYTFQKGEEAFSIADGCVEEALQRIKKDISYGMGQGVMNLSMGNGSCTIAVTEPAANHRKVEVTGWVDEYYKQIEVNLTLSGNAWAVDSWKEI